MTVEPNPARRAGRDHEPPLTVSEAATVLSVTERWIRRAVHERRLPYIKVGHHVRFLVEDLRDYLSSQRIVPPSPPGSALDRRLRPFPVAPPWSDRRHHSAPKRATSGGTDRTRRQAWGGPSAPGDSGGTPPGAG